MYGKYDTVLNNQTQSTPEARDRWYLCRSGASLPGEGFIDGGPYRVDCAIECTKSRLPEVPDDRYKWVRQDDLFKYMVPHYLWVYG